MKLEYLKTAWLVLAMALVFGSLLAGIQITLKPVIEANKIEETFSQVPVLVPGADPAKTVEVAFAGMKPLKASNSAGEIIGWVTKTSGQGYAGKIELLIGLDKTADTITGLYILGQTETPGLGDFITGEQWRSQFAGQSTNRLLIVVKTTPVSDGEIEAITGATVSSDAVINIVNKAVAQFKQGLLQQNN